VDWNAYDTTSIVPKVNWRISKAAFYAGGPTDYFSLRLKGTISVPQDGEWVFRLGSESRARLLINGLVVVNDDAAHAFRFTPGTVSLSAGTHDIEIRYLELASSQSLFLTWQGPDGFPEEVVPSSAFSAAALESPGGSGAGAGGLAATWTTGRRATLNAVDWTKPVHTSKVDNLYWRLTRSPFFAGGPRNYFAASFKGTLVVPETGLWSFRLGSDSGARLIIGGKEVINDDANHAFRFTGGAVHLDAGRHAIEVQFIELTGSQGLVLTWTAPSSIFEEVVPASAFATARTKILRWKEVAAAE